MKTIITFIILFLLTAASIAQTKYGIIFLPGVGGSSYETYIGQPDAPDLTYDHNLLLNQLRGTLGQDLRVIDNLTFQHVALSVRATQLNQKIGEWMQDSDFANREWFIFGHSMGGVTAAYFNKVANTNPQFKIRGTIAMQSPFQGIETLKGGKYFLEQKFNLQMNELGMGVNGDNPWLLTDLIDVIHVPIDLFNAMISGGNGPQTPRTPLAFEFMVDFIREELKNKKNEASVGFYDLMGDDRTDVKSMQKGHPDIETIRNNTFATDYLIIGATDFNLTAIRLVGSKPNYCLSKPEIKDYWKFIMAPTLGMSLAGNDDFNVRKHLGPAHSVAMTYALRTFFDNRVTEYRASEHRFKTLYDVSLQLVGEWRYQMNKAKAAKERYIVSRRAVENLDIAAQDLTNDLDIETETVVIHHYGISNQWLQACQTANTDVGFKVENYSVLPALLTYDCDDPLFVNWTETRTTILSINTVETDGMIALKNQKPTNAAGSWYEAPNTNPNDGHNHAAALWVVKPWNKQETETMRETKRWIREKYNEDNE
ncbi:MAG: alpha/beta hydrolase [Bacteroidetes bacterium]|nr:alpha/beta hydrolase [Bacteroidota bacterium]